MAIIKRGRKKATIILKDNIKIELFDADSIVFNDGILKIEKEGQYIYCVPKENILYTKTEIVD